MPRMEHRFVITLHDRLTGDKITFHLGQWLAKGSYWMKWRGRNVKKYNEITGTEIGRKITQWLKCQQNKVFKEWDL